ncbi:MAG: hypothetical protein QOE47_309, partial [Pyrinomonadaceae bacterium]|nr:hypothetical protein [Pyrinomonadaceae bacterium]
MTPRTVDLKSRRARRGASLWLALGFVAALAILSFVHPTTHAQRTTAAATDSRPRRV